MRSLIRSSAFAVLALSLPLSLGLAACGDGDGTASADAPAPAVDDTASLPAPEVVEAAAFPQEYSDISVDPAVRYGELPNGFRYAILQNDTPSGTGALRLRFDMGSLMESEEQLGLAHFLEHMAFNGSENVEENEMIRILERAGLAFGADTNASTGMSETIYMLDLPETDEETLDTSFMLMDELSRLTIAQDAVDRERGVVLSELRARNSPDWRAYVEQTGFLFEGTLLPDRMPIGTVDVLTNAPAERLRDLYERYYTPERAFFVAVGDFDPDEIEQRITEAFSDWEQPADAGADPDLGAVGEREPAAAFFQDPSLPTMIDINFIESARNLPDMQSTRRENLLRGLGISMLNRRFDALSRSPDAIFLQASAGEGESEDVAEGAWVTIYSEPQNWQPALTLAENEMRRAITHGFSEAELAEQLANQRAAQENAAAQADTRQTPGLANGLISAFSGGQVFTHPSDSLERFNRYTDGLAVDEVNAVFREAWDASGPLIWMTSAENIPNAEAAILAAYEAAAAMEVEAPAETAAAAFAYTDFGAPGEVAERELVEDLAITRIRFANNVMLNFKQTDFEQDVVRVNLRFGGGLLEVPLDRPALQYVAGNIFTEGGTNAHSLDELQRLMAGKTVSLGFSGGTDSFGAGARTTPVDLETQLQLWAGYMTDAAYRPEALTQFKQLYRINYPTMDATPDTVIGRDVPRIIHDGDERWGYPPVADVESLTAEDARALMQRALANSAIEIGIVGDITEEEAVAVVARTFGALPEREAAPQGFDEARNVSFPAAGADRITLRHVGEADQAAALVYWPAADGEDAVLARRLSLLVEILQVRAIEKIREELGATYSPSVGGSFSREFPGYGYLAMQIGVDTADVDEVFAVVDEIAADFAAGNIQQDEFDRALRPLLEGIEENQEQNPYWMGVVAQAQTRPENLDRHRSQRADYEAITLDDIKAAAAQYLDPARAVRIQVLPPETAAAAGAPAANP